MVTPQAGRVLYQVDAFTSTPFQGNPAVVCILEQPADEGWMRSLALEMNLTETAFLYPKLDGWHLRWFTRSSELDLCGHATLASAHVLWETERVPRDETISFFTLSGRLVAERDGENIRINFPNERCEPADPPPGLLKALAVTPLGVFSDSRDYIIEVDSEETLKNINPSFRELAGVELPRAVVVTCRSTRSCCDYLLRFFMPSMGIDEDFITGSVHCSLAPFWQERLGNKELTAHQPSRRGGFVKVLVAEDRVIIFGRAVMVMRMEML